jgi:hypothetical protein
LQNIGLDSTDPVVAIAVTSMPSSCSWRSAAKAACPPCEKPMTRSRSPTSTSSRHNTSFDARHMSTVDEASVWAWKYRCGTSRESPSPM